MSLVLENRGRNQIMSCVIEVYICLKSRRVATESIDTYFEWLLDFYPLFESNDSEHKARNISQTCTILGFTLSRH